MSNSDDVVKIGKKLDKMVSNGTTDDASSSDILNLLKKFPMTFEILQKTRIGMAVNNFRKACTSDTSITLAKSLIKQWKKLLPESSSQSSQSSMNNKSGSNASIQRTNSSSSFSGSKDEDSRDSTGAESQKTDGVSSPTPGSKSELCRQTSVPAPETADAIRLKCRELLTNALKTPPIVVGGSEPENIAAFVEDHIFQEFKNTEMKYKNRVRSRVANLRDAKNPHLRENVLMGLIPPDRIAVMTAEEMASDELKKMRAIFTKKAIDDHQMSRQGGTRTTLFKCGRCGRRDCSYNQVQTRSADEPMTTFVVCNDCGNRWKFC